MQKMNRFLAMLLALVLVLQMVPVFGVAAAADSADSFVRPSVAVYPFPGRIYNSSTVHFDTTTTPGVYVFDSANVTDGSKAAMLSGAGDNTNITHTKDLVLIQTVCIEAMPAGSEGLKFNLSDRHKKEDGTNAPGGDLLLGSIYNDNGLKLLLAETHVIDLGKGLGEEFELAVEWNADNSGAVYVDGICKAKLDNVNISRDYAAGDNLYYSYATPTDGAKFYLTNVAVYNSAKDAVAAAFQALIASLDLSAVFGDANLPAKVTCAEGEAAISWTSSDTAVLSHDGKVVAMPAKDTKVTLTATCAGNTATVTATVKASDYIEPSTALYAFPAQIQANQTANVTVSGDVYTIDGTVATATLLGSPHTTAIDHVARDLLMKQTIKVDALPEQAYASAAEASTGGFTVYIIDRVNGQGTDCQTVALTIVNEGGKLYGYLNANTKFNLGVSLGDEFELMLRWNTDNSAVVYVDGMVVGKAANATIVRSWNGNDQAGYKYNGVEGQVKLTWTDAAVYEDPAPYVAEAFEALIASLDLSAVYGNANLPTSVSGAPIYWTSSNPAVLSDDGKVVAVPAVDTKVTLTANCAGNVATVEATVKAAELADAPKLGAERTANISGETGYGALIFQGASSASGKLDAYWDDTNLYLLVAYSNATKLDVTAGSYSTSVSLSAASGTQVVTLPLADLGITVQNLNQFVQVQAILTDSNGNTARIAQTAAKIYFAADSEVVQNVSIYNVTEMTNNNGTVTVDKTFTSSEGASMQSSVLNVFNGTGALRTENLLLEQTICIDALPVVTPAPVESYGTAQGLGFFVCDNTTAPSRADYILQGVFFADSKGNLSLVLGKSTTVIDLGVKLGRSFKLGVQWNTNDAVDVYVNNVYVCTISSAVYMENYQAPANSMGLFVRNTAGEVKASFSGLCVKNALPKSISEVLGQADVEEALAAANPTRDFTAITGNLVLPATVDTVALGKLPIVWSSSNTDVIANDGTVTLQETYTSVTLTAKLGGQTVATLNVKVADKASDLTAGPHIPAYKTSFIYFESYTYPASFIPAGNVTGSLDARWNSSTLYLSIKYANASTAKITVGDYVKTVSLSGTSGTKRVDLSFSAMGIQVLYSNQVVPVQVELIGSSGTAYLSETTASIYLTVKPSTKLYSFPAQINTYAGGVYNWDYTSNSGVYVYDSASTVTDASQASAILTGGAKSSAIDHEAYNLLWQQTVTIDAMPAEDYSYNGTSSNGLVMHIVDRYDNDGDGVLDGQYTYGILASIRNAGGGSLMLHIADLAQFKLNRSLGDTFTLGMQWNMDDTLDIYVDHVYIGSVENATINLAWVGTDNIGYAYRDLNDTVKITLTDVHVYEGIPAANAGKLTQQGLETLFAQSNPNVDVNAVTSDVVLPTSYTGASGEAQTITWVSSNENVVSSTGEVTAQGANYVVALNAYIGDELVGKIALTVIGTNRMTISTIQAGYTTSVTVDGAISENSWILNSAAMVNGAAALRIGAQWNTSNLYFALQTADLSKIALKVNGVTIDLAGSMAVTSGNITELAIPMTTVGVTAKNYGVQIPVEVTVNGTAYSLTVVLTSISWTETDNSAHRVNTDSFKTSDLADHGVVVMDDGYYIYDHYNNSNVAYSGTQLYYNFLKDDPTLPAETPLWPSNQTYYLQFDFQATSMPVYDASVTGYDIRNSNCGVSWAMMGERATDKQDAMSDCVLFGIYNNGKNLVFVISGEDALVSFPLNKQVGDLFRIGIAVAPNDDLQVYIDGELVRTVTNAEKKLSGMSPYKNRGTLAFRVYRNEEAAKSGTDNFDVYMTNLAFGLYYGESVLDSLTFDTIKGKNTDQMALTYALSLPTTFTDSRLGTTVDLTWSSSDTSVISTTGTVTRPSKSGQLVTLTAATADGDTKEIQVYVKGKNAGNTVMTIVNDLDPETNYGKVTDLYEFTLDQDNSSVVYNQGSSKTFNVVRLADGDAVGRLHKDLLKLYISDNNANYVRIEDFKLLQVGRYWYLYGFEATARYVKVHCTHYNGAEADFTGPLAEMIYVYQDDNFGAAESFVNSASCTITNSGKHSKTDYPWAIDASSLGGIFLADNYADARFYLGGELLLHYYENGKFYVRVPYVAAGETVTLTVKAGNSNAIDLSNKEAVYEVIYGSRELTILNKITGNRVARTLTMSDGRIIGMDVDVSGNGVVAQYSSDQGYSWTSPVKIPESDGLFNGVSGFIYDDKLDRIIIVGYIYTETGTATNFIYTDDCGATWNYLGGTTFDGSGYVDGIILATNDGAGPNVDYVLGVGAKLVDDQGATLGLQAFSAYSADGGLTWYRSEALTVDAASGTESGISENSIYELQDGTLVMYARWQDAGIYNFAVYYSYNHGLSWTKDPVMSEIYTVNTNPVLLDDDGKALLVWSGNTALGGDSYRRTPLNIAASFDQDQLLQFGNIQDLYVKYSLQGLDTATQNQATNPHFRIHGDKIILVWMNNFTAVVQMHLDDYRDFIYKTKGAYDSFEGRTVEYEGWASVYGNALQSNVQAYAGSYSMLLEAGSAVARSVPSVSKGQLSMQVYVPDGNADFVLELQTAFSSNSQASPISLKAENGMLGGVQLKDGWNSLVFDLQLDDGAASLSVNGQAAQLEVAAELGDYICYVYFKTHTNDLYVDEFTLMDADEEIAYAAEYKGVNYKSLSDALDKAASDGEGTVTMLSDVQTTGVSVPLGVQLDMNGFDLSVDSLASYGNVYDSTDGKSVLSGTDVLLAANNSQLPVYDSAKGGYRFFTYSVHNYGTKLRSDKVTFGFGLLFDNADVYTLLAQGDSGVDVRVKLSCTGASDVTYSFDAALVQQYAQLVLDYPGAGAALMLHVTGVDGLTAGDELVVTPSVATATGVAKNGSPISYTAG